MAVGTYLVVRPGSHIPIDAAVVSRTESSCHTVACIAEGAWVAIAHGTSRKPVLQAAASGRQRSALPERHMTSPGVFGKMRPTVLAQPLQPLPCRRCTASRWRTRAC